MEEEYIDFGTSDLGQINTYLLDKMENSLFLMEYESRLCSENSAKVVAEYGFKGDKEAVYKQLLDLYEYRKEHPYTKEDIPELKQNKERFLTHLEETKNSLHAKKYREYAREAFSNPSPEKFAELQKLMDVWINSAKTLHEKKECLCFNNF